MPAKDPWASSQGKNLRKATQKISEYAKDIFPFLSYSWMTSNEYIKYPTKGVEIDTFNYPHTPSNKSERLLMEYMSNLSIFLHAFKKKKHHTASQLP